MSEIEQLMKQDSDLAHKSLEKGRRVVDLTSDEVQLFENILRMEAIHNALALNLSQYRESIIKLRNEYVSRLTKKYQLDRPVDYTYDPVRKKLVSVFDPDAQAHKIIKRPDAFADLASQIVRDAVKRLDDLYKHQKGL